MSFKESEDDRADSLHVIQRRQLAVDQNIQVPKTAIDEGDLGGDLRLLRGLIVPSA